MAEAKSEDDRLVPLETALSVAETELREAFFEREKNRIKELESQVEQLQKELTELSDQFTSQADKLIEMVTHQQKFIDKLNRRKDVCVGTRTHPSQQAGTQTDWYLNLNAEDTDDDEPPARKKSKTFQPLPRFTNFKRRENRPVGSVTPCKVAFRPPSRPSFAALKREDCLEVAWDMKVGPKYARLNIFELCASRKGPSGNIFSWEKFLFNAETLPMVCELPPFTATGTYTLCVRAVDVFSRKSKYSNAVTLTY